MKKTTGWVMLVFLAARLVAAETSPAKPTLIALPAGVTSAEIQQALDALPASGGEVVLPPGRFEIRQPIVLQPRPSDSARRRRGDDFAAGGQRQLPGDHPGRTGQPSAEHRAGTCASADCSLTATASHQQRELWQLERRRLGNPQQRHHGAGRQRFDGGKCHRRALPFRRAGHDARRAAADGARTWTRLTMNLTGWPAIRPTDCLFTDLYLHDNPGAGISLDLAFNHNVISNAVLTANDLGIFMRASRDNQFLQRLHPRQPSLRRVHGACGATDAARLGAGAQNRMRATTPSPTSSP